MNNLTRRGPLNAPQAKAALAMILLYGGIDGAHHKDWVLDQVVRMLTGTGYEKWVEEARVDHEYSEGIAP